MDFRVGHGYDVHALQEGLPMRLAGVDIASPVGFVAHSDGDVLVHALCDALLGAAALGDIGLWFPDSDPQYKGADSILLLQKVCAMIREKGYGICNVDVTIALQAPKLRPYIEAMRDRLAEAMAVERELVSVKATTTEKLGFVGRQQGAEATAVALISR